MILFQVIAAAALGFAEVSQYEAVVQNELAIIEKSIESVLSDKSDNLPLLGYLLSDDIILALVFEASTGDIVIIRAVDSVIGNAPDAEALSRDFPRGGVLRRSIDFQRWVLAFDFFHPVVTLGRVSHVVYLRVEKDIAGLVFSGGLPSFLWVNLILSVFLLISIGRAMHRYRFSLTELQEAIRKSARINDDSLIMEFQSNEFDVLAKSVQEFVLQRRRQLTEIVEERDSLEAILSQSRDGYLMADEGGKVLYINRFAADFFQTSAGKAIGRSLPQVVYLHQVTQLWTKHRETGAEQRAVIELPGRRRILEVIMFSIEKEMKLNSLLLVRDLTNVRRLETMRRDFIGNLSHELRTPIASLKALSETLQEGALDDPAAARRFLSRLDTEIESLFQMVNQLLDLSRIESGQESFVFLHHDACDIGKRVVGRMRAQAERNQLDLQIECSAAEKIRADGMRLEQVLVNLIHNAIKFTPPGGRVEIRVWQEMNAVQFSVRDTGIGIASEDLPRIFERFYKSDRSRSGGGTGLGLAISKHIVESHGGRIWAESIEGQGATFTFSIPLGRLEKT